MATITVELKAVDGITDILAKVSSVLSNLNIDAQKVTESFQGLSGSFSSVASAAKGVETAFDGAAKSEDQYAETNKRLDEALKTMTKELDEAKKKGEESHGVFSTLKEKVSDAANEGFDHLKEKLIEMANPQELAAKGFEMVAEALKASIEEAAKFDQQLTNLAAAAGIDRTSQEFDDLGNAALEVGKKTKYSSDIAIQGFNELRNKGLEVQDIIGVSIPAAYLAEMQGAKNMTDASKELASALNSFKLPAADAQHMADEQAKAFQQTGLTTKDYSDAIKNAGAIAQSNKQSFESFTAALEVQKTAGIDGARASVNYRQAISALIKPNSQAADMITNLGLQVRGADGNLKDYADIVQEVTQKTANLDPASRQLALTTIFGKQGFIAMTEAMNAHVKVVENGKVAYKDGAEAIRYYEQSLQEADGTTEEMAETMRQSLEMTVETLKGSITELSITIGKSFLPGLQKIASAAGDLVNELIEKVNPIAKDLEPKITGAFMEIRNAVVPIFEGIIDGIGKAYDAIKPQLDILFADLEKAGPIGERLGEIFGSGLSGAFQIAGNAAAVLVSAVDALVKVITGLQDAYEQLPGPIKQGVEGAISLFTGTKNHAEEAQKSVANYTGEFQRLSENITKQTDQVKDLTAQNKENWNVYQQLSKDSKATHEKVAAAQQKWMESNQKLQEATKQLSENQKALKTDISEVKKELEEEERQATKMEKAMADGHKVDAEGYAKLKQSIEDHKKLVADASKANEKAATDSNKAISGSNEQTEEGTEKLADKQEQKQKETLDKIAELHDKTSTKITEIKQKELEDIAAAQEKEKEEVASIKEKEAEQLQSIHEKYLDTVQKLADQRVSIEEKATDSILKLNESLEDKNLSLEEKGVKNKQKLEEDILKLRQEFNSKNYKTAEDRAKAEQAMNEKIALAQRKYAQDEQLIGKERELNAKHVAEQKDALLKKEAADLQKNIQQEAQAKQKEASDIQKAQDKMNSDIEKAHQKYNQTVEKSQQKATTDIAKATADQTAEEAKLQKSLGDTGDKQVETSEKVSTASGKQTDTVTKGNDAQAASHEKLATSAQVNGDKVIEAFDKMSAAFSQSMQQMAADLDKHLDKLDNDLVNGFSKVADQVKSSGEKIQEEVAKTTDAVNKSADKITSGVSSAIEKGNASLLKALESFEDKLDKILDKLMDKVQATKDKLAEPVPMPDAPGGDGGGGATPSGFVSSGGSVLGSDPGLDQQRQNDAEAHDALLHGRNNFSMGGSGSRARGGIGLFGMGGSGTGTGAGLPGAPDLDPIKQNLKDAQSDIQDQLKQAQLDLQKEQLDLKKAQTEEERKAIQSQIDETKKTIDDLKAKLIDVKQDGLDLKKESGKLKDAAGDVGEAGKEISKKADDAKDAMGKALDKLIGNFKNLGGADGGDLENLFKSLHPGKEYKDDEAGQAEMQRDLKFFLNEQNNMNHNSARAGYAGGGMGLGYSLTATNAGGNNIPFLPPPRTSGFGGGLPRFEGGAENIPSDMFPAYLDKGEMVLPAQEAERYRGGGGGDHTTTVMLDGEPIMKFTTKGRNNTIKGRLGANGYYN